VAAELGSGVAVDGEAEAAEVHVASVVVLEGHGAAVVVVEVRFHGEATGAPEEVDLVAADLDVDLGRR
jgi:hypothetical protein